MIRSRFDFPNCPGLAILASLCLGSVSPLGAAQDELSRQASWKPPSTAAVRAQLETWLQQKVLNDDTRAKIDALWSDNSDVAPAQNLDLLTRSIGLVHEPSRQILAVVGAPRGGWELPRFDFLSSQELPEFARANLRLLYGRWLAVHGLYDESLEQIGELRLELVVDPATLLFYQGLARGRILDKEQGLEALNKLLEREDLIARRYASVARLVEAELTALKPDSLDEISRLMDNVQLRLGHARAGTRVRGEEDQIVKKLDKLIEKLEQQQQQMQSGAGAASGNIQPSSPMEDSMPGGGTGPGHVDPKKLTSKESWGNLPPKERQEALQQLGKDYPAHYRDVIEEYFRKLARDDVGQP